MARYRVNGEVSGGKYLGVVEAESVAEAKEKAQDLDSFSISLCHQCAGECEDAWIVNVSAELDTE